MHRRLATLTVALILAAAFVVAVAPTAFAHNHCSQFSEHDHSTVVIVDTVDNIGPIPLIYPIVTTVETNVVYDFCQGWHHHRWHQRWIPTAIQMDYHPQAARGDVYRCGAWDWMRARFNFWDGHGRSMNPRPITATCHSGWSGGSQYRLINSDRTALHYDTQRLGVPRGKSNIQVEQNLMPDEHTRQYYRLDPWNVFNKQAVAVP